jgi:hypothetical protein
MSRNHYQNCVVAKFVIRVMLQLKLHKASCSIHQPKPNKITPLIDDHKYSSTLSGQSITCFPGLNELLQNLLVEEG